MKVYELIEALKALEYDGAEIVMYNAALDEEHEIAKVEVDDDDEMVVLYGERRP